MSKIEIEEVWKTFMNNNKTFLWLRVMLIQKLTKEKVLKSIKKI